MSAASIAKSSNHRWSTQVTVTTPTHAASGTANVEDGVATVAATVTGVALGDTILASPTAVLPTSQYLLYAYVDATDSVTFVFYAGTVNAGLTGASRTFNVTVLDKTS